MIGLLLTAGIIGAGILMSNKKKKKNTVFSKYVLRNLKHQNSESRTLLAFNVRLKKNPSNRLRRTTITLYHNNKQIHQLPPSVIIEYPQDYTALTARFWVEKKLNIATISQSFKIVGSLEYTNGDEVAFNQSVELTRT